jgi:hypothetical protein
MTVKAGKAKHLYSVINVRDGRIVHIQGVRTLREARQIAGVS